MDSKSLIGGLVVGLLIGASIVYVGLNNQILSIKDQYNELVKTHNDLINKYNGLVEQYNTLYTQAKNIESQLKTLTKDYNDLIQNYSALLYEKYSWETDYNDLFSKYQQVKADNEALISAQNLAKGEWNDVASFTGSYQTSTPLFNILSSDVRVIWKTTIIGRYPSFNIWMYNKNGEYVDAWLHIHEPSEGETYLHGLKIGQYYLDFDVSAVSYEVTIEIWVSE